jgi:hypothetical protein
LVAEGIIDRPEPVPQRLRALLEAREHKALALDCGANLQTFVKSLVATAQILERNVRDSGDREDLAPQRRRRGSRCHRLRGCYGLRRCHRLSCDRLNCDRLGGDFLNHLAADRGLSGESRLRSALWGRKTFNLFVDRADGRSVDNACDFESGLLLKFPHCRDCLRAKDARPSLAGRNAEAQKLKLLMQEADGFAVRVG